MLAGVCTKIDTTSDRTFCPPLGTALTGSVRNCGALGNLCTFAPLGASGACINSICTVTSCPTGYTLILSTSSTTTNTCRATLVASGAVHLKKRSTPKKTLCPSFVPHPSARPRSPDESGENPPARLSARHRTKWPSSITSPPRTSTRESWPAWAATSVSTRKPRSNRAVDALPPGRELTAPRSERRSE